MKHFAISIRIEVDEHTHENLQTFDAIESEIVSWLEDLGAGITAIVARESGPQPHLKRSKR